MRAPATFGVDLGGTHLRVGVVDPDGEVVDQRRGGTPHTLDEIVDQIAGAVEELHPLRPEASTLGVGAAGMVDGDGVIHYSPNVPAFLKAPVRERVSEKLKMSVVVDNDANAAVVAEVAHGVAQGMRDVLLLTLGTGVGGGIVMGGQILRGAHGFGAEVGHFQVDPNGPPCACGQRGHWEAVASGTALGRLGRAHASAGAAPSVVEAAGGDPSAVTGEHVGDAARDGAPDAVAIIEEYASQVAVGLVGLVNVFDPEIVVMSGGLVGLGDVLFAPMRAAFAGRIEGAPYRPPVPIVAGDLGENAGVIGAAVLARGL
jgi:glucokinase